MATFYVRDWNPTLAPLGFTKTDQMQWRFQPNSRVGAKVSGETFDGRVEIGASRPAASFRYLYGVWKFSDDWKLKVGRDDTPIKFDLNNQVFNTDQNLDQIGSAYGGHEGGIAIEGRRFKFAAISPVTKVVVSPIPFCPLPLSRFPHCAMRTSTHLSLPVDRG